MRIMLKLINKQLSFLGIRACSSLSSPSRIDFDVVVIGGSHAGTEACAAASRMNVKTLLVTHKKSTIGEMSCNPSFGGIGKGHLIREVDALDGVCGKCCDQAGVQYKVLNKRRGPAVWGPRAQIDRKLYRRAVQEELDRTKNLEIVEGGVDDLIIDYSNERPQVRGVILEDGREIYSKAVVITT